MVERSELDALVFEEARELVGRQIGTKTGVGPAAGSVPARWIRTAATLARLGIDDPLAAQPKLAHSGEEVIAAKTRVAIAAVEAAGR
jgi:hypothetical protein